MSVMGQNCDRCQVKQGGYRICGVQCKMKMQLVSFTKNFKAITDSKGKMCLKSN